MVRADFFSSIYSSLMLCYKRPFFLLYLHHCRALCLVGSFWLRPHQDASVESLMHQATAPGASGDGSSVGFSSRPVQLGKISIYRADRPCLIAV